MRGTVGGENAPRVADRLAPTGRTPRSIIERARRSICLLVLGATLAPLASSAAEWIDTNPVPANHVRIATFNLEVFNFRNAHPQHAGTPYGPRTPAQLDLLAARIIGLGAAIIALQEINQLPALADLRERMNGGAGSSGPWQTLTEEGQQNAFLYDDSRVDLRASAFRFWTAELGVYPEEAFYRSPVTAVFTPEANADWPFYVVGIHGSWQGFSVRERQGTWLGAYLASLIDDPSTPDRLVLAGDMNGSPIAGDAPHDGLVASGHLTYLPKANGESTAIGGAAIDHLYVSQPTLALLSQPSTTVVRNDAYDETTSEFRECCSDHFAVYVDLPVATALPSSGPTSGLVLLAIATGVSSIALHRARRRAG